MRCFLSYSTEMRTSKQQFIAVSITVTLLGMLTMIGLALAVLRNQKELFAICHLIKTNSYINENLRLSDTVLTRSTEQEQ